MIEDLSRNAGDTPKVKRRAKTFQKKMLEKLRAKPVSH